jgi:hypothetical protein
MDRDLQAIVELNHVFRAARRTCREGTSTTAAFYSTDRDLNSRRYWAELWDLTRSYRMIWLETLSARIGAGRSRVNVFMNSRATARSQHKDRWREHPPEGTVRVLNIEQTASNRPGIVVVTFTRDCTSHTGFHMGFPPEAFRPSTRQKMETT